MKIDNLVSQLLEQLDKNEEAKKLITDFAFNSNYSQEIRVVILEQMKQGLVAIECNDEIDMKNSLELSVITQFMDEFNNNLKNEKFISETKKTENTKKHEREQSTSSAESSVAHTSKKPRLTLSFDSYRDLASSSTQSVCPIIQRISSNILSFKAPEQIVLVKRLRPPELQGKIAHLEVSRNAAIFNIQNIQLDECWCTGSLDRSKEDNTRTKMEENIVKTIREQVSDKTQRIRLVNIGSDKIGLLVILSKLYLLGYKNIDIINLETAEKESFVDCQTDRKDYSNLLKTIFSNADYKYLEVYNKNKTDVNLHKNQIAIPAEITVFFAEDLGGLDDANEQKQYTYNSDYKNIIANAVLLVTSLLLPAEKNPIFYSTHNGDIARKTIQQACRKTN